MITNNIYAAGGTVQASDGIYIERQADNDLLKLCQEGKYSYVLTARQLGKSSLMIRAAENLLNLGTAVGVVDLTELGVNATAPEWYLGFIIKISNELGLDTDIFSWWQALDSVGYTQRLVTFFQEEVLSGINERIIIFVDEIDTTLNLDYTDDFFAAVRFMYNARAINKEFNRLSFVLIGVARPGDLIDDSKRTPFNIGEQVDLVDFTFDEAKPLAQGLSTDQFEAKKILQWILDWTGGHPYLTQRICKDVAEEYERNWSKSQIDDLVVRIFMGETSQKDSNLDFVRDMLTIWAPDQEAVLQTYRDIYDPWRKVRDDEQSLVKNHLKLSGIVNRQGDFLKVRNALYRRVFDRKWIREHQARNWWRVVAISSAAVAFCAILLVYLIFRINPGRTEVLAESYIDGFESSTNSAVRMVNLANLFSLGGYDEEARNLFFSLTLDEQIALFEGATASELLTDKATASAMPSQESMSSKNSSNVGSSTEISGDLIAISPKLTADPSSVNSELFTQIRDIVRGTYAYLYVDDLLRQQDTTPLLQSMADALDRATDQESQNLVGEIKTWVSGRKYGEEGNYSEAKAAYDAVINFNSENPAVYFERAQVSLLLNDYGESAGDLAIAWEKELPSREQAIRELVVNDYQFHTFLLEMPDELPFRDTIPPIPVTPTPTTTASPSPSASPSSTPNPTATPTITPAPIEGHILFDRISGVPSEIYVMDADGSNATRLTDNDYQDDEADLSPDGQSIAFESKIGNAWHISVMPVGGGIPDPVVSGRLPDWSPDGELIAYETVGRFVQIGIVNVQANQSWLVTDGERSYRSPSWHPEGREIATMSEIDDTWQIVVLAVDEHTERIITNGSRSKFYPAWSPDGNLIAYNTVDSEENPDQIWVIDSETKETWQITNEGHNGRPAWSPNGQYLIFNANMTPDLEGPWLIHRIRIDGTSREMLTKFGDDQRADWGP